VMLLGRPEEVIRFLMLHAVESATFSRDSCASTLFRQSQVASDSVFLQFRSAGVCGQHSVPV
jgi:hypothetical protein